MKYQILHIAEAPGGVEKYIQNFLKKMRTYEQYEHVLICSDAYDIQKFNGLVKSIEIVHTLHNAINIVEDISSIIQIRKLIKKYKPDIVFCHSSKAGAVGRIANIGIRNKLIYNAHGWSFNMKGVDEKKIRFYIWAEKVLSLFADEIVCISEYEKISALEHRICVEDKLVVINSGIDFDEFKDMHPKTRMDLKIPADAFVIGTVGRLSQQKAPDIFVKMAGEVKKSIPNAFFMMVGDDIVGGGFREETEYIIKKAGLKDSFFITGWVDDPLNYVSCFDVATLLSRWEGFGLVLPEYMYLEKPIVASKADAIPYVLGNAGFLVDVDDYHGAAEKVIEYFTTKSIKNDIIEKGKARVEMFNAERMAREYESLFRTNVN